MKLLDKHKILFISFGRGLLFNYSIWTESDTIVSIDGIFTTFFGGVFILYLINISNRSWKPIERAKAGADLFLSLFSVLLFGMQSSTLASFPGPCTPPHILDASHLCSASSQLHH